MVLMVVLKVVMVIDGSGYGGCDIGGHEGDESGVDGGCDDVNFTRSLFSFPRRRQLHQS
jgi:hypothetical protein